MNLVFATHTILLIKYVIDRPVDVNAFIVIGDITSLYTNIDIKRSIDEVAEIFASHPTLSLSLSLSLFLLDTALRFNDFEFAGQFFLQVSGTATGKRFTSNLANNYLIKFDKATVSDFIIKPQHYFRFIDDNFFICCGSLRELKEFEVFLNNVIPGISYFSH
jgi:hypothetical protein